jgi:hypothetical protein
MVFLMDSRFNTTTVTELMPPWMKRDLRFGDFTPATITQLTHEFWEKG